MSELCLTLWPQRQHQVIQSYGATNVYATALPLTEKLVYSTWVHTKGRTLGGINLSLLRESIEYLPCGIERLIKDQVTASQELSTMEIFTCKNHCEKGLVRNSRNEEDSIGWVSFEWIHSGRTYLQRCGTTGIQDTSAHLVVWGEEHTLLMHWQPKDIIVLKVVCKILTTSCTRKSLKVSHKNVSTSSCVC